jgi:hypothetical protein
VRNKRFVDTRDKSTLTLFEALTQNYIIMKDELNDNYQDDPFDKKKKADKRKNGIVTHHDILSMFNPMTGVQISVAKAIDAGIYDRRLNVYIDLISKRIIGLAEAIEKGLVVLKPSSNAGNKENNFRVADTEEDEEEYEQLTIKAIRNPVSGLEMPLNEAIAAGFLDYAECEFHDPVSGKTFTLLDAYDKGYLITTSKPLASANNNAKVSFFLSLYHSSQYFRFES